MARVFAHSLVWFFTTAAAVVAIGVFFPIFLGMALSGGTTSAQNLDIAGLHIFKVVIDGSGGFEAGFGPGLLVIALIAGLTVSGIAGWSARRGKRPESRSAGLSE